MAILVFNPGSTTLKTATITGGQNITHHETIETWDLGVAARTVLSSVADDVTAIGCRVVHGGREFTTPCKVTPEIIASIEKLGEIAPLHNYGAAAVLRACLEVTAHIPVVAVFDTAFHSTMPPVAHNYALPQTLVEAEGIYRYGFHGIVHQANAEKLTELLTASNRSSSRLISCHLGGGASICAIQDGRSVDTTMGFTPLEGLMMATRSGDVDPGVLLHLLHKGWTEESLRDLLNQQSGLLGVSGISNDPRPILAASAEGNAQASLAIELYTYRIAKQIAALTIPLGGLDGLAFSGGVGQNSAAIRERICNYLGHLGVQLNADANYSGDIIRPLHNEQSPVGIWALASSEEHLIAELTEKALAA